MITAKTPDSQAAPLIVTLALDDESQARLDAERTRWFPPALNRIPAHVSLFHALPGIELTSVSAMLDEAVGAAPPFPVEVTGLMRLGRGVAYRLRSPELVAIHTTLRNAWLPWLTPQDRQGYVPHVVVQNKVQPAEAERLYHSLHETFTPWTVQATGLLLWHYRNGPWELAERFALSSIGELPEGSHGLASASLVLPSQLDA